MRAFAPLLLVLVTGCGAASTPPPSAPPRVVEVVPVHEEPPAPPPKPPPPPTPEELAVRMATALEAGADPTPKGAGIAPPTPQGGFALGELTSVFGGSTSPPSLWSQREEDDVMVSLKVVSTTGKFIKDGLQFALDMNENRFTSCLVNAQGGERKGSVTVAIAFDREGAPIEPVLQSTTFKEKNLAECVREAFRRIDPVSHTDRDPSAQANNRATVQVNLERPQGF